MNTLFRFAVFGCCIVVVLAGLLSGLASLVSPSDLPASGAERRSAIIFYTEDERAALRRVEAGVRLLAAGDVSRIVMAGGWRPGRGAFRGAVEMRNAAVARGASLRAIVVDNGSNDSWSNLEQARAALVSAGAHADKLVLVSDRLHLLRLALIAQLQGASPMPALHPTPESTLDLRRLGHELAAYCALALPRSLVRGVIGWLRHA